MSVYIDTSAFYALASSSDVFHDSAKKIYQRLLQDNKHLITTSYVLIETIALIHRRLGFEVLETFVDSIQEVVEIIWVDKDLHEAGWKKLETRRGKDDSLVDCVSFLAMHEKKIKDVFANDPHFKREGFILQSVTD